MTRAVRLCAPSATAEVSHAKLHGEVVAVPATVPSTRNSTRLTSTSAGAAASALKFTVRLTHNRVQESQFVPAAREVHQKMAAGPHREV